jgi:hypothetical protein
MPVNEPPTSPADSIAPVLPVRDVDGVVEYLCRRVGFAVQQPRGDGREWAVVQRGKCSLVLVPADWPSGWDIPVNDADDAFAQLSALGAEFESPPMNQEYGQRDFSVRIPGGSVIRFWGRMKLT